MNGIKLKENLNALIKARKLSLHQVSKRTNINKSSLHNYLNGVLPQGLAALIKLSVFFGVSVDELLFGKDRDPVAPTSFIFGHYEIVVKKIDED